MARRLGVVAPVAEELLAVEDEAVGIVARHDEHGIARLGSGEGGLGRHAPVVGGNAFRRAAAQEEVHLLQVSLGLGIALKLLVREVAEVEACAGGGGERFGRYLNQHAVLFAHLTHEAVEVLVLAHLLDEHCGETLVEAVEAAERLVLLLGMVGEAQRRGLQVAEVLGVDHAGIVLLEVLHAVLYAVELSLLAVGYGVFGGTEYHFDGGTLGAVDAAQGDAGLQVQTVVGESPFTVSPQGECFAVDLDSRRSLLAGQGDGEVAALGHVLVAALALSDANGELLSAALVGEGRRGVFLDVVLVLAVVFVEREVALLGSREDAHDDGLLRAAQVLDLTIIGNDAARLDVDGVFVHRELALHGLSAPEHRAGLILQPLSFGQPCLDRSQSALLVDGAGDGCDEHAVAEHVLFLHFVGLLSLGVVVVHRAAKRDACLVVLACHGVYIGYERVASVDDVCEAALCHLVEGPRLFVECRVLGAVAADDGQVLSHLHGTGVEFGLHGCAVLLALVSAYVVAPVAVEDVGGGAVEVGQEAQAFPRDVGVAREAYLVAVVAEAAPAVVEQGTLRAVPLHVGKPDVVAPEDIVEVRQSLVLCPLLPVEPPEVDAFVDVRVQVGVEECLDVAFVAALPLHGLAVLDAGPLYELLVLLFVGAHAVGGVQVHGCLHALLVKEGEELLVVGEEPFVPVPSCPAAAGLFADGVPVHVDDEHVEGEVKALESGDEVAQVLVGVAPVAAPPVAEGVAGRQGHFSGKLREAAQGALVVVTVGHEVPVLCAFGTVAFGDPVPVLCSVEEIASGVVDERPAVGGKQSVLEGHLRLGVAVLEHVAVVAVQCAVCSLQVALLLGAGRPGEGCAEAFCRGDAEVLCAEGSVALLIGELQLAGGNDDFAAAGRGFVRHVAVFADDGHEALVVDELAVGCIFQSQCSLVDEGEAYVAVAIDFFCLCCLGGGSSHCCQDAEVGELPFHVCVVILLLLFSFRP